MITKVVQLRMFAYVLSQFVAFCVGLVAFFAGASFILFPEISVDDAALGTFIPTSLDYVWPALHSLGGGMLVWGILRTKYSWESAGAAMLAMTIGFDTCAVIYARGWQSGAVSASIMGALALGYAGRVVILTRQGR